MLAIGSTSLICISKCVSAVRKTSWVGTLRPKMADISSMPLTVAKCTYGPVAQIASCRTPSDNQAIVFANLKTHSEIRKLAISACISQLPGRISWGMCLARHSSIYSIMGMPISRNVFAAAAVPALLLLITTQPNSEPQKGKATETAINIDFSKDVEAALTTCPYWCRRSLYLAKAKRFFFPKKRLQKLPNLSESHCLDAFYFASSKSLATVNCIVTPKPNVNISIPLAPNICISKIRLVERRLFEQF